MTTEQYERPDPTGTWVDPSGFLELTLTADGHYEEARGGQPHTFQGRFWTRGDRIDYRDDQGFWGFAELVDDELHHAGRVMHRHDGDTLRRSA